MIARDGMLIIVPCPNCEHDMLEENGLVVENKSLTAKCQKCGESFNIVHLRVFRSFEFKISSNDDYKSKHLNLKNQMSLFNNPN